MLWEKPGAEVREEAKRLVETMYRAAGLEVPVDVVPWPEQEEYKKKGYRIESTSMFGKIWYLIYPPESSTHQSSNPNVKCGPLGFKMGPVKRWLSERETLVKRPKFFKNQHSNPVSYNVKYIDLTGRTQEKEFTSREIPDLYKQQREGKVSIISIHKVSNPNPIGVRDIDSSLESMKDEKKREWREKGYPEGLIAKALLLAQEWAYKMSAAFAPPEAREAAIRHNLSKGLDVADRWIKTMGDAVLGAK